MKKRDNMTDQQKQVFVNALKEKVSEINSVIKEINLYEDNPLKVTLNQADWNPMVQASSVKNAVKYLEVKVSETFSY